ncbi:MAG: hypothetical protein HYY18_19545 [Planctomycetes bacterium]|nr:hypothetical protein [Planctomycetota bacterium]
MSAIPEGRRRGAILIWVLVAMILLGGIVTSGLMLAQTTSDEIGLDLAFRGQAMNVAQAGLVDAHSWFRRQLTQPVVTFAPQQDLAAVPPVNDTDDPAIGIVRDFEIGQTSLVWGRYEVRIGEVTDITQERSQPGAAGGAWRIRCHGFVYQRLNAAVAWNVLPNRVISSVVLESEIQRMNIVPPADAAVCCRNGASITVAAKGRVQGNTRAALNYQSGTGAPVTAGGEVVGSPAQTTLPAVYPDSLTNVFGLTQAGLKSVSDDKFIYPGVGVPMGTWPALLPTYHLIYVEGNLVFDATKRLNGTAIIYVKGNVTINASSNSFFSGMLYVEGNLVVRAPSLLKGTMVVTGTVDVRGLGDYSEVEFDKNIREDLLSSMGQYRFSKPPVIVQQ